MTISASKIPQRKSFTAPFIFGCSIGQVAREAVWNASQPNIKPGEYKQARLLMYQAFDQIGVAGGTPEGH